MVMRFGLANAEFSWITIYVLLGGLSCRVPSQTTIITDCKFHELALDVLTKDEDERRTGFGSQVAITSCKMPVYKGKSVFTRSEYCSAHNRTSLNIPTKKLIQRSYNGAPPLCEDVSCSLRCHHIGRPLLLPLSLSLPLHLPMPIRDLLGRRYQTHVGGSSSI